MARRSDEKAPLRPRPVEYRAELRRAAEEAEVEQLYFPESPTAEGSSAGGRKP